MAFLKHPNRFFFFVSFVFAILTSCSPQTGIKLKKADYSKDIEMTTNVGTIVIRLYDDTPLHKENFLKLTKQGFYDSILFHRVIETFMVQAGDPDSRKASTNAALGESDLPYKIPAELNTKRFHKRGALGAARDGNPERASSSTQFYIVHGKPYTDSLLTVAKGRINNWLAMNKVVNDPANSELVNLQAELRENEPESEQLDEITTKLDILAKQEEEKMTPYEFPEQHAEIYSTEGGAAHLDQNYTVFGEVVSGMEVVDKIAGQKTNDRNRPLKDIRILKARLIDRNQ